MAKTGSLFRSVWFSLVMSIISIFFLIDYARLVFTTDDSTRRIVVLCVWFVIAAGWTITFLVRLRGSKKQEE